MLKTAGWLLRHPGAGGCSSSGQRHEQTLSRALAAIGKTRRWLARRAV